MEVHKRMHRPFRLIVLLLAACLAVAALVWSHKNFPAGQTGEVITLPEGAFALNPDSGGCYALAGNGLATVTTGGWQLFDENGALVASEDVPLDQPACAASETLSVFYDMGAATLLAVYPDGTSETLEAEGAIRFADVNEIGHLAVITEKDGYKGAVTVYNRDLKPLFRWDAGSAWPVCARLSDDGKLAVACATDAGSSFHIFRTDREEPLYSRAFDGDRLLDAAFLDEDTAAVMTDAGLRLLNIDRGVIAAEEFDGRFPAAFEGTEDLAVFATTPERFGGEARVVSLSGSGRALGSLDTGREILSLDIRGKYILILYPGELKLYSRSLEEVSSLPVDEGTQSIFLRPDGTALLLGANGAERIEFG